MQLRMRRHQQTGLTSNHKRRRRRRQGHSLSSLALPPRVASWDRLLTGFITALRPGHKTGPCSIRHSAAQAPGLCL